MTHTQHTSKEKINSIIDSIMPECHELVKEIESKPQTTQNWYGDYMGLLGCIEKTNAALLATGMIRAGGNKEGILAAIKSLGLLKDK